MKSTDEVYEPFRSLWSDIESASTFPNQRPLLAHYTSISTLEAILTREEVWFSNPLYMNDVEELRFGILESMQAFRGHRGIREACETSDRYLALQSSFEAEFNRFNTEHAFDIYVFCMSEHDGRDDGLLSMWRGYGENGNGAAIVIDSGKFNHVEGSPMIISKVTYASQLDRLEWISRKLDEFADLIRSHKVPDNMLYLPASALFERIKVFALFTKHHGFSEEREWRAVYLLERDRAKKLEGMLDYVIGRRGIESKLKYKVRPIEGITKNDLSLVDLINKIILGPSGSSPLAVRSVRRMLEKIGKPELMRRLASSSIPFRAT